MYQKLVNDIWDSTPGLVNVILAGTDGIIIARQLENDEDEYITAEAASIVKESQRFGGELDSGPLRAIVSQYEELTVVVQLITDEYFLVGIVKETHLLGLVRYRLSLKSYEWYSLIA